MLNIFTYAKAIAAFVGSIVTAVLAVVPPGEYRWLSIVGVILTAVATYRIPNYVPVEDVDPPAHRAEGVTGL